MSRAYDGTDNTQIEDTSPFGVDIANNLSYAIWVWPDQVGAPDTRGEWMSRGDCVVMNGDNTRIEFAKRITGTWVAPSWTWGAGQFNMQTWHSLVFTLSSTAGMVGYVDGVSRATNANATNVAYELDPGLQFGARGTDPTQFNFRGRLAEAAIWNVVLTPSEVVAYARGVPANAIRPSALRLYVPMYGTASPERDYTAQQNTFDITGGVTAAPHPPVSPAWGGDLWVIGSQVATGLFGQQLTSVTYQAATVGTTDVQAAWTGSLGGLWGQIPSDSAWDPGGGPPPGGDSDTFGGESGDTFGGGGAGTFED